MSMREKVVDAGRKVLSTDQAQVVVETVVDKVEDVAKDTVGEAGDRVKARAARAGGRRPRSTTRGAGCGAPRPPRACPRRRGSCRLIPRGLRDLHDDRASGGDGIARRFLAEREGLVEGRPHGLACELRGAISRACM